MSDIPWHHPAGRDAPPAAVRLAGVGVDYGDFTAVNDVHLHVPTGEIFGLLGPNGAGKTTIFRVLATLMRPTRGEAWTGGIDLQANPLGARTLMTYMPDLAPMPSDLRAVEYLRFFAECHGLRGRARDLRVDECLDLVSLSDQAKQVCNRLSLGMRQRLALARSILHRPQVLLLDEPASGLDPVSRVQLKQVLKRQAAAGATVIISSHIMAEIEDLCTSLGLLRKGRLIDAGPIARILEHKAGDAVTYRIEVAGSAAALCEWLVSQNLTPAPPVIDSANLLTFAVDGGHMPPERLFRTLAASGFPVTGMRRIRRTVEDVVVGLADSAQSTN